MDAITIPDLDEAVFEVLKASADRHGRTVEAEACTILTRALEEIAEEPVQEETAGGMFRRIREANGGGVDLELPDRSEWKDRPLDFGS